MTAAPDATKSVIPFCDTRREKLVAYKKLVAYIQHLALAGHALLTSGQGPGG
jgi:hypothetical protein